MFGMILEQMSAVRAALQQPCGSRVVPDAAELGAVVVAIDDVVEDLQHQLPQLAVLHQRDGEERVQKGRGQRRRHGLGLEPGGHLRKRGQSG